MSIYSPHLVTYGFDGLLTCYDAIDMFDENKKPYCVLAQHHRFDGGIQQAIIDYKGKYVITKGKDGFLICSRIR